MSELSLLSDLRVLSKLVYLISKEFPKSEEYNTISQIKRAVISVSLNVREGNVFKDNRKITHFERALGSLVEVDECMILAVELGWIKEPKNFKDQYWLCLNKLKKLITSITSEV